MNNTCKICADEKIRAIVDQLIVDGVNDSDIRLLLKKQGFTLVLGAIVKHRQHLIVDNEIAKNPVIADDAIDGFVNRTQLAMLFAVSLPTIDAWLRKGCPHSKQDKQYRFSIANVAKWLYKPVETDNNPNNMSPKDQLDWYRAQREKNRYLLESGDLMLARDFEIALSDSLKQLATSLEALPDLIERNTPCNSDVIDLVRIQVDYMRQSLYNDLIALNSEKTAHVKTNENDEKVL